MQSLISISQKMGNTGLQHMVRIYKFDITSREFEHYGINDGLPNSYLYCIYEDESGYLWMSSNFGIIRFDPKIRVLDNMV